MNAINPGWFFIVNPHAGSGKTMCEWVPAEKKLEKLGIPYCTAYTDYKRHAMTLAAEAADNGFRKICAVGGDGSVHETFCGILNWCEKNKVNPLEFTLAVVPIGSGNDWIKSLGIEHDVEKVIELMDEESIGQMDVISMVTSGEKKFYMANIGGVGFDSHVCQRVNLQKEAGKRSKTIYLKALLYTVFHLGTIDVTVVADGKEVYSGECLSIALGNGKYSGGMMIQVPLARIDDGILDAMIVPKLPLLSILKELPKILTGTINESTNVITVQCKELQVIPNDAASADVVEADGEIEGVLPLTVSVTGMKINVLTAEPSTKGL